MIWPAPTRADHDRFCRLERWNEVRNATGGKVGHHITYELSLPDGRILRTRVSRPPNRETYGAKVWGHILRDQLDVGEEAFWACVRDGTRPERGAPQPAGAMIPLELAALLKHRVGLTDAELGVLNREEAIERLNLFWVEGR